MKSLMTTKKGLNATISLGTKKTTKFYLSTKIIKGRKMSVAYSLHMSL